MSEKQNQPKKLTPAEICRIAADIYESLPEGYELAVIEALCNMEGRTAVSIRVFSARSLGIQLDEKFLPSL